MLGECSSYRHFIPRKQRITMNLCAAGLGFLRCGPIRFAAGGLSLSSFLHCRFIAGVLDCKAFATFLGTADP